MELIAASVEQIITHLRSSLVDLSKQPHAMHSCVMLLARDKMADTADSEDVLLETHYDSLSKVISHGAIPELLHGFCNGIEPFAAPKGSVIFLAFNAFWSDLRTGQGAVDDTIAIVYQTGQSLVIHFKDDGAHVKTMETLEEFWQIFRFVPVQGATEGDWN